VIDLDAGFRLSDPFVTREVTLRDLVLKGKIEKDWLEEFRPIFATIAKPAYGTDPKPHRTCPTDACKMTPTPMELVREL
jgi:hypothetical protein